MGNDLDVWVQHFKNEGWELTQAGQDNAEFEKITRGPWVVAADDPAVVYSLCRGVRQHGCSQAIGKNPDNHEPHPRTHA